MVAVSTCAYSPGLLTVKDWVIGVSVILDIGLQETIAFVIVSVLFLFMNVPKFC